MPSPYVLRARKVGRPLTEDGAYAEMLGVTIRIVRRLGGAKYMQRLPPENLNLLLKSLSPVPRTKGWSLRARGMEVKKPHSVGEKFEAHLHELMVQKGLVKDA